MEWTNRGIVLSCRKHSERDVILEAMTEDQGRHHGLVRGGRSPKFQPLLQPGNDLSITWRARLADHLGNFSVEPLQLRAAELMEDRLSLYGIQHMAALLRLLPERDPHPKLFNALNVVIEHLGQFDIAGALMVRFELELLSELGFGLDLSQCAATGKQDDLAYVSPKSGRAVSRDAGRPYHGKLLPLPAFLIDGQRQPGSEITFADIHDGFRLTDFFLKRNVLAARIGEPADMRTPFIGALEKAFRTKRVWEFSERE